jgi:hypothetical protein
MKKKAKQKNANVNVVVPDDSFGPDWPWLVGVMLICLLLSFLIARCETGPTEFEQDVWLKSDDANYSVKKKHPRIRMAYGLRESKLLVGKTKSEVIELLGRPDTDKKRMVYWLGVKGQAKQMYPSTFFLVLYYDSSGEINKAEIKTCDRCLTLDRTILDDLSEEQKTTGLHVDQ